MSHFIWYELLTDDAAAASSFYEALMGWKIVGGEPGATGAAGYRHLMRSDGQATGGLLPLSPDMQAQGARPCWVGYLYAEDVERTAAAIVADGGRLLMPTMTIPEGRFAMVTDPQGVPFYLMTPTPPPDRPAARSDAYDRRAPQRVAWNELYSADLPAAQAFYGRHFGFTYPRHLAMGPEFGDYVFIDDAGEEIGAMMKKPPQAPCAAWNHYLRVDDIDVAADLVTRSGGQVFHGPVQVPGGEWVLQGLDPQGAGLAVVGERRA